MRRLLLACLAALTPAAPATAKQPTGGEICGTNGCRQLGPGPAGGVPAGPPGKSEPYLVLRLRYTRELHTVVARYRFLPRSGLLTGDGRSWSRPAAVEDLRRAAQGLEPYGGAHRKHGDDVGWIAVATGPIPLALGLAWVARRRRAPDP